MNMQPTDIDLTSLFNKGVKEQNTGNLDNALQIYEKIIKLKPNHCEAVHNKACVLTSQNELIEALKIFKDALNLNPNVSLYWINYIKTLVKLDRISEAKALIVASKESNLFCKDMEALSLKIKKEHGEASPQTASEIDENYYNNNTNTAKGLDMLVNPRRKEICDKVWTELTHEFENAKAANSQLQMSRDNISFHEDVKLLGYLCQETSNIIGDILEIGVWKGKSLAYMQRLSPPNTKIVGVDPCELAGQLQDLTYFHNKLFNTAEIIVQFSEKAVHQVSSVSKKFKLIHIDGGHRYHNVWMDFLLYERFLVPGGYIVFDDYNDTKYSPEVGLAVNELHRKGFFDKYTVIGSIPEFKNSFIIKF